MATDTGQAEPTATVQGWEIGADIAEAYLGSGFQVEYEVGMAIQDREPLSELRDHFIDQCVISAPEQATEYMTRLEAYDFEMSGEDAMRDFRAGAERGARSVITVKRLRAIAAERF